MQDEPLIMAKFSVEITVNLTSCKNPAILTWHKIPPFSLRFAAPVLFCSLGYVTKVDSWSFSHVWTVLLVLSLSLSCRIMRLSLACCRAAEYATAQHKLKHQQHPVENWLFQPICLTYLRCFNCATFGPGKQNLIDSCTDFITTRMIASSVLSLYYCLNVGCIKQTHRSL